MPSRGDLATLPSLKESHGAALGEDEVAAARKELGWEYPAFQIPDEYYQAWDARDNERWVVMQVTDIDGARVEQRRFLDETLQVVRETSRPSQYFADLRPWFTEARPGEVRKTAPYLLSMVQERGISYTVGSPDGAVAGAIVLLSSRKRSTSALFRVSDRQLASAAREEDLSVLLQ